jgi:hypothetical protein
MIRSLLPLFMMKILGTSVFVFVVGIIEGLAESTTLIVKVFSVILATISANGLPI